MVKHHRITDGLADFVVVSVTITATILVVGTGCRPSLPGSPGLVEGPRVLAVQATPAEAPPAGRTRLEALVVDLGGTVAQPDIAWSLCTTPRAPGENGALPQACLDDLGAIPADDNDGDDDGSLDLDLPADACVTFGPETGSGQRPRDADGTGGYHQPLRLDVNVDDVALQAAAFVRLACRLGDAPVEIAQRFADARRDNRNPDGLVVNAPDVVGATDDVDITVSWDDADAECFLRFDRGENDLVETREQLTASFFVTDGRLRAERLAGVEGSTTLRNRWSAPDVAGLVHLWVVLRDGRGGTKWSTRTMTVE